MRMREVYLRTEDLAVGYGKLFVPYSVLEGLRKAAQEAASAP